MKLYLFRHADAATQAENDDERAISTKGIKQCERVAKFCSLHRIQPDIILASPILRAQQTARSIARKLGVNIETVPWLMYENATETKLAELAARAETPSVMIVGHEPDFGLLVSRLLGAKRGAIRVRKGSLLLLNIAEFRKGGARLEWSFPAQLL